MTKVTRASLDPPRIRWLVEPTFDSDGVQVSAGLDELSREHLDPVPMAPPVGLSVVEGDPLHETLRRLVRDEMFRVAVAEEEFETLEEAEDFDVDDDMFPVDPQTPYEEVFDPPPPGGGPSRTLASEAPNGKGGPSEPPTQPISEDQRVSVDSASEASPEKTEQKPTVVEQSRRVDSKGVSDVRGTKPKSDASRRVGRLR